MDVTKGEKNPTHLGNLVVSYLALRSISVITDFYFGPLELHLCLVLVCLIPGFRLGYTAH